MNGRNYLFCQKYTYSVSGQLKNVYWDIFQSYIVLDISVLNVWIIEAVASPVNQNQKYHSTE